MSVLPPKADIVRRNDDVRYDDVRYKAQRGCCADQGDRDQSTLMFAARMTLAHFSVVSARSLA
jgi:hypothetical protein